MNAKVLVIPLYGLAAYGAGMFIGSLPDDPAPAKPNTTCIEIPLSDLNAIRTTPVEYLDYIAMDNGYGEWAIVAPDSVRVLGFATQEDSRIFPNLECIYTQAEYPALP